MAVRWVEDFTEQHSVSDFLCPGSCVEGCSSEGPLCVKAQQTAGLLSCGTLSARWLKAVPVSSALRLLREPLQHAG